MASLRKGSLAQVQSEKGSYCQWFIAGLIACWLLDGFVNRRAKGWPMTTPMPEDAEA